VAKVRKIFFFLPDYPECKTGGIKYHTIIYDYFKQNVDDVSLLGKNCFTKYVNKLKILKVFAGLFYILFTPSKSIIVSTNTEYAYFYIPVLIFNKFKKHFHFLVIHHLLKDENPKKYRDTLEKNYIKKADYIVTNSIATKRRLIELDLADKDTKIITPGIDFYGNRNAVEIKSYINNNMLMVGTVEPRKGQLILIEALKYSEINDFKLSIVGQIINYNYYNKLIEKIKEYNLEDKINFYGKVDNGKLIKLYSDSFMFVFPSLWEGYGMVIAEAMSNGLAIISSKIESIKDFMEDGKEGLYFEPGNYIKMCELIKLLYFNRDKAREIGQNAFIKSKQFISWNVVCEKYFDIINEIR